MDKEGYDKAQEYLKKAIEEDPTYAMAYSGLADTYYDASTLLFAPNEVMPKAKAAAQKAVELDPSLAMAHVSLGIVASKYDWDWKVAEHEFQTALAQDPSLATAHLWYGLFRAQLRSRFRRCAKLWEKVRPVPSGSSRFPGAATDLQGK